MTADALAPQFILEILQNLVRIPSVNPTLASDEPCGEADIAGFVRDWLDARGIEARLEEAAPGRPNVFASVGADRGPTLVFCAHLDTVGTAGMTIPPFEPRVEGNRVYGRGSFDMKGGVAAILAAAVALRDAQLHGRVLLALVADEEYSSLGADDFVRRHRADGCILAEASEGRLITAHRGYAWIEARTHGRQAHGSRWDIGVSAIARMGRIVAALDDLDRRTLRARTHPLVGPASLHCAKIDGGVGLSTYAPDCTLAMERRTIPGETPESALEEIRSTITGAGEEADLSLIFSRPPLTCDPGAKVARAAREAIQAVHGEPAQEGGVPYWMDAAVFGQAGIPAVDYGPSGFGAHEAVEWVDLDSVVRTARVLAEAARRFTAEAP